MVGEPATKYSMGGVVILIFHALAVETIVSNLHVRGKAHDKYAFRAPKP